MPIGYVKQMALMLACWKCLSSLDVRDVGNVHYIRVYELDFQY